MLSRLFVIVYCVKNRSTQPAMTVSPIPPMSTGLISVVGRSTPIQRRNEKAEDDERDRDPLE